MSFYRQQAPYVPQKPYKKRSSSYSEQNRSISDEEADKLYEQFLEDWEALRDRHEGQKEILHQVRELKKRYGFMRIGRKGAKTTTNIDIAWDFCMEKPRRTCFICLPTITQAIEVYWDEKRLQWCDGADSHMSESYIRFTDNNKHMLTFVNGSTIKLAGTWSEARGRGTQPDLMIVDEIQDCSADYLDAMEPNLAAKPDSLCIMAGTPPKKKNHYHEWEERIKNMEEGFHVKYSSYINTALPHLKGWLDNKKKELITAGKEDVWLREYMADDCFRSDDRMLPDVQITDFDELMIKLRSPDPSVFQPILGIFVTEHNVTATFNLLLHNRFTGTQIYTLESRHFNRIWDRSYTDLYSEMSITMNKYGEVFKKPWTKLVFDQTDSFSDIIPGLCNSLTDLKWSKRGIPLLKEMLLGNKLILSTKASDIGVEAQNLLKEDDIRDYPILCTMAMIANEYYQAPSMSRHEHEEWNKFAPLRDAGIVTNFPRQKRLRPYLGKYT